MSKASVKPTAEQIAEWKAKYGAVYKISTEDGQDFYLFDPLSSLTVMKQAFTALSKSSVQYVVSVLNNCLLHGDESILTNDEILLGLVDQIDELTRLPECKVTRNGNKYVMTVEDQELQVRAARREDVIRADQKNVAKQPFETAIHLLKLIAVDNTKLAEISKNNRIYIGFLTGVEQVKNKASILVEKL